MQIRTKLTLQFIFTVASILFLAFFFVYSQFRSLAEKEFFESLRSKALMTASMILNDPMKVKDLKVIHPVSDQSTLPFKENVVILNDNKEMIFSFNKNALENIPHQLLSFSLSEKKWQTGATYYLAMNYSSKFNKKYLVIAKANFIAHELDDLKKIMTIVFFCSIILLALGGYVFTKQALDPVAKIVDEVDNIQATNLHLRLKPNNSKDELGKLVNTFNSLLERLQNAFHLQKSFISNVSHELRNPLSIIISQLEVALQGPKSERSYRTAIESSLVDIRYLSEISENLLQMAKLKEQGYVMPVDDLMLDDLLLKAQQKVRSLHPDYEVHFDLTGNPKNPSDYLIKGNAPLLNIVFINLMDNCCKYSANHSVNVELNCSSDHLRVLFRDKGIGMDKETLDNLFQPFYRNDEVGHLKGAGIGMALVQSILKLHNLPMEIQSEKGVGTIFTITFK